MTMRITRTSETEFEVLSESGNTYAVTAGNRWKCSCPARWGVGRMECKHLRTVRNTCGGMPVGETVEREPVPKPSITVRDPEGGE